ncbi:DUF192 domain-containing protein [Novosphingobium sp. M1R2S20]|uniref:DUF192 domain-containing protein n=1 Tax=Novosphingobium rhizovicinum TaxID=3228928 RepID=A0ABV3RAB4_9SPHN
MTSTILALALALGGCSSGTLDSGSAAAAATQPGAVHPISGLPVIDLVVSSKTGAHNFRVEVASTPEQQARGLMFRTEMAPDEGMLFPERTPRQPAFWMKNTVIPLDIIYVGTDGRVLNIVHGQPYDLTPLPAAGLASGVLELNGGRAAELGIEPGDKVRWNLPNSGPAGGNPLGRAGEGR